MFSQIASSLSKAATVAAEKAKETYTHLKSLPTEVGCPHCKRVVMVPPETFNWVCTRCQANNAYEAANCTKCNALKPSESKTYTVMCTMCKVEVEVPTTNAVKSLKVAAETTKAAAIRAKDATVQEYHHLKSVPATFHCGNCNTELHNPNHVEGEGAPSAPSAPSAPAPSDPSAPSAPPAEVVMVEQKQITEVMCPICKKVTPVPTTNFRDTVTVASASITRGAAKAFYLVAGKKYADCPSCKTPVELVPPQPAPQAQPQAQPAPAPSAQPAQPQAQASSVQQHVEAACKKCGTVFPATI